MKAAPARVWLHAAAWAEMADEGRAKYPDETGGMLLGYRTTAVDADEIVITGVIGPGPAARHAPQRFEPDGPWQQTQLEAAYARSGRVNTYLGDWHTHPAGRPAPSRHDSRCARRIARRAEARAPHPLILILGEQRAADGDADEAAPRWGAACFRLARTRLRPAPLYLLGG